MLKKHSDTCAQLGIEDYRVHDIRHTFAVRAVRVGASFEYVAAQLGHGSTQMTVNVYTRFRPTEAEMRDWERLAELQDKKTREMELIHRPLHSAPHPKRDY